MFMDQLHEKDLRYYKNTDPKPQPDLLNQNHWSTFNKPLPQIFWCVTRFESDRSGLYATTLMIRKFSFRLFHFIFAKPYSSIFSFKTIICLVEIFHLSTLLIWRAIYWSLLLIIIITAFIICAYYIILGSMFCATFDVHNLTVAFKFLSMPTPHLPSFPYTKQPWYLQLLWSVLIYLLVSSLSFFSKWSQSKPLTFYSAMNE